MPCHQCHASQLAHQLFQGTISKPMQWSIILRGGKPANLRKQTNKLSKLTLLHFNARSICNEFDAIKAEITILGASIVCITETWLTATASTAQYSMGSYNSFYNHSYKDWGRCDGVRPRQSASYSNNV